MAKLVTKFKFLKAGSRNGVGGYAKYIATREGVEKIDESQKSAPATVHQKRLVSKILKDFPDSKYLLEYTDYQSAPTCGNASEFISRAIEENASAMLSSKTYADYIATRPRVQKFGTHGLFTDEGVAVNLREVSKKLNAHTGNVWTAIVSLRREDAERLGFNSGERWRDMLRSQANTLAAEFHIPMQHLKWYAAFHNEGHHPHIHMIIYSDYEKQGFLTKKGVENLRSSFAAQIFAQDLQSEYKKQTKHRDELRQTSREVAADIIARISNSTFDNPELELKLLLLSEKLNGISGKKQYGFLPAELKNLVDSVVDDLAKDPRIAELYDLWYEDKEEIIRTYTEHMPKRVPLSQNKEFRTIQNCVIKEALLLKTESATGEKPISPKAFDDNEMSEPVFKPGKAHDNPMPEIHHDTYENRSLRAGSVIRLIANAARIIQDKLPGNHNIHNSSVDRRIRKQIREKKIAHGQKQE